MSKQSQSFEQYVGQEPRTYYGWDPVNEAMIRHWCDAMGDFNPVYLDPEAAARSVHGGLVAPPAMLQAWIMRGYGNQWAPGSDAREPMEVLEVLEEMGYPAVVAVNCEQEYHRYLRPGDKIHYRSSIESVSEEKTTALGVGFFITELSEFYDQNEEHVATMRFRVLKYRAHAPQGDASKESGAETSAGEAPAPPEAPKRMRPVRNYDTAFFWEGVDRGELLIQRCADCQTLRHPPAPMCPSCQSLQWDTVQASGRGVVHSFVIMHHPPIPPFDYPNPVVLVELDEGTRLISQLQGVKPRDIEVGMPVEVVFREVEDGLTLPLFQPRGGR